MSSSAHGSGSPSGDSGTVRRIVRLQYPESLIREPLLSRMILEYEVLANIRRASVTETVGEVVLEVTGPEAAVEAGIRYLEGAGVIVDPILGNVLSP